MIDTPYPSQAPPASAVPSLPTFAATTKPEVREKVIASLTECRRLISSWKLPYWQTGTQPPPAVLLRCTEREKVPEGAVVALVDVHRSDDLLGWGSYKDGFVTKSWDIDGSHFGLFEEKHVSSVEVPTWQRLTCVARYSLHQDPPRVRDTRSIGYKSIILAFNTGEHVSKAFASRLHETFA